MRRVVLRYARIATSAGVALWATLITLGNVVDYGSNFEFVRHVMSMDTTFPGNRLMGRAIMATWLHHAAYWLIIAVEGTVAVLCWCGAVLLYRARREPRLASRGRDVTACGYLLAILLWFVGFMVIGGEWFAMWQSGTWNGIDAAFRVVTLVTLFLILLYLPDGDGTAGRAGPPAPPEK